MACWLQLYKFGFPWIVRSSGELECLPSILIPSAVSKSLTTRCNCCSCDFEPCSCGIPNYNRFAVLEDDAVHQFCNMFGSPNPPPGLLRLLNELEGQAQEGGTRHAVLRSGGAVTYGCKGRFDRVGGAQMLPVVCREIVVPGTRIVMTWLWRTEGARARHPGVHCPATGMHAAATRSRNAAMNCARSLGESS